MNNKLICPFCQQRLVRHWGMTDPALYCCENCSRGGVATESSWQELIRTRKALDVAVVELKRIKFRGEHSKYECCKASGIIAQGALDKITALEQKE